MPIPLLIVPKFHQTTPSHKHLFSVFYRLSLLPPVLTMGRTSKRSSRQCASLSDRRGEEADQSAEATSSFSQFSRPLRECGRCSVGSIIIIAQYTNTQTLLKLA